MPRKSRITRIKQVIIFFEGDKETIEFNEKEVPLNTKPEIDQKIKRILSKMNQNKEHVKQDQPQNIKPMTFQLNQEKNEKSNKNDLTEPSFFTNTDNFFIGIDADFEEMLANDCIWL